MAVLPLLIVKVSDFLRSELGLWQYNVLAGLVLKHLRSALTFHILPIMVFELAVQRGKRAFFCFTGI